MADSTLSRRDFVARASIVAGAVTVAGGAVAMPAPRAAAAARFDAALRRFNQSQIAVERCPASDEARLDVLCTVQDRALKALHQVPAPDLPRLVQKMRAHELVTDRFIPIEHEAFAELVDELAGLIDS